MWTSFSERDTHGSRKPWKTTLKESRHTARTFHRGSAVQLPTRWWEIGQRRRRKERPSAGQNLSKSGSWRYKQLKEWTTISESMKQKCSAPGSLFKYRGIFHGERKTFLSRWNHSFKTNMLQLKMRARKCLMTSSVAFSWERRIKDWLQQSKLHLVQKRQKLTRNSASWKLKKQLVLTTLESSSWKTVFPKQQ